MRALRFLTVILLAALLHGCALWPERVEYFQRKVKPLPEVSAAAKETQRQAADYVARKTEETKSAALDTGAEMSVVIPAAAASTVADALSDSLGPPVKPWEKDALSLARQMAVQEAEFNRRIEAYRKQLSNLVGHKVEGTGLFTVGYFTQWIILLAVVALAWAGLKIYGLANPVVGVGTRIAGRVGAETVKLAFTQTMEGIEAFKSWLSKSDLDDRAKSTVKEWIRIHTERKQDQNVQALIRSLTTK